MPPDRNGASESGVVPRPGRVLLVDDDVRMARVFRDALSEDHEVVLAADAIDALVRLASGERYDVVLCDVQMPQMDGIEFHRRLRVLLPDEADRVVFASGDVGAPRVVAYFEALPNVILEKPIDLQGFGALVERRARRERETDVAAGEPA
jgi:CheY-like chemotaxis protein